jgi:hypothetical protein
MCHHIVSCAVQRYAGKAGVDAVVAALTTHLLSAAVQEQGCVAMGNLTHNADNQVRGSVCRWGWGVWGMGDHVLSDGNYFHNLYIYK